jgi:hypothetical protein
MQAAQAGEQAGRGSLLWVGDSNYLQQTAEQRWGQQRIDDAYCTRNSGDSSSWSDSIMLQATSSGCSSGRKAIISMRLRGACTQLALGLALAIPPWCGLRAAAVPCSRLLPPCTPCCRLLPLLTPSLLLQLRPAAGRLQPAACRRPHAACGCLHDHCCRRCCCCLQHGADTGLWRDSAMLQHSARLVQSANPPR